jgi:hypothetical protein
MGSSDSKAVTTNKDKQTIVSKNIMDTYNDTLNETIITSSIDNSASCKSSTESNLLAEFSDFDTGGGDFNLKNFKQESVATVNFKCIQMSEVKNDVAQDMVNTIVSDIEAASDATASSKMTATADAASETGFASFGMTNSDSTTNNTFDFNLNQTNEQNITNVVKNVVNTTFDVTDVQECINEVSLSQELKVKGINTRGGNVQIEDISQSVGIDSTTDCLQKKGVAQKITNELASALDIKTVSDVTTDITTDITGESTSTAKSAGFFTGLAEFAGSMQLASIAGLICIICLSTIAAYTLMNTDVEKIEAVGNVAKSATPTGVAASFASNTLAAQPPVPIPYATPSDNYSRRESRRERRESPPSYRDSAFMEEPRRGDRSYGRESRDDRSYRRDEPEDRSYRRESRDDRSYRRDEPEYRSDRRDEPYDGRRSRRRQNIAPQPSQTFTGPQIPISNVSSVSSVSSGRTRRRRRSKSKTGSTISWILCIICLACLIMSCCGSYFNRDRLTDSYKTTTTKTTTATRPDNDSDNNSDNNSDNESNQDDSSDEYGDIWDNGYGN